MNDEDDEKEVNSSGKNKAKLFLVVWTLLYTFCFFFALWTALMGVIYLNLSHIDYLIRISTALLCVSMPIIMFMGYWRLWTAYRRQRYDQVYKFWALPIFVFIFFIIFALLSQEAMFF